MNVNNVNVYGRGVFHRAIIADNLLILEQICNMLQTQCTSLGAVNADNFKLTPTHLCVIIGNLHAFELVRNVLLQLVPKFNKEYFKYVHAAKDQTNYTPFQLAVRLNRPEFVQFFIDKDKVNANQQMPDGSNVIEFCIRNNLFPVLDIIAPLANSESAYKAFCMALKLNNDAALHHLLKHKCHLITSQCIL